MFLSKNILNHSLFKSYKRKNEDDLNEENSQTNDSDCSNVSQAFKSAKEQLMLDNAKQQSNQSYGSNSSTGNYYSSLAKRPLNHPAGSNSAK